MMELERDIPDVLVVEYNEPFWLVWDRIKHHRFKLKWGIFRPSFRLHVLEPFVIKLLGPRRDGGAS